MSPLHTSCKMIKLLDFQGAPQWYPRAIWWGHIGDCGLVRCWISPNILFQPFELFSYILINTAYTLRKVIASSLESKFTHNYPFKGSGQTWLTGDLLTSQALPYLGHFALKCTANAVCLCSPVIPLFVLPTLLCLHWTQVKTAPPAQPLAWHRNSTWEGESSRVLPVCRPEAAALFLWLFKRPWFSKTHF